MQDSTKMNQPDDNKKSHNFYVDEKTQERIDKHLRDVNDEISEEDIQNISTDINSDNLSIKDAEKVSNINDERNDKSEDDKNDIEKGEANEQLPTAFNILGS